MAPRTKSLKGRQFGRWTVIGDREVSKKGKYQLAVYLCRCACGTEATVQQSNLLSGCSQSCGCLAAENSAKRMSKAPGIAATNQVLGYYRNNAKKRNLAWELTDSEFMRLIHGTCVYCGINDSMVSVKHKDRIAHNGIDRKDPSGGYIAWNCVTCCKTCNTAKSSMTVDEFRAWVKQVYDYTVTQNRLIA